MMKTTRNCAEYEEQQRRLSFENDTREDWEDIGYQLWEQITAIESGVVTIPGKNMSEVLHKLKSFAHAFEIYASQLVVSFHEPVRLDSPVKAHAEICN